MLIRWLKNYFEDINVQELEDFYNPSAEDINISDVIPTRAIIDGLLYDTSKAEKIFTVRDWIDSFGSTTNLYVTSNNRFFTEYKGDITPKTEEEVKVMLSKHPDEYQKIFGKVKNA